MGEPETTTTLGRARELLDQAQAALQVADNLQPTWLGQAISTGLTGVIKLVDLALAGEQNAAVAEQRAVYGLVAEWLARVLGTPEEATYHATLRLCGVDNDSALLADAPPADPELLAALSRTLVQITVDYSGPENGGAERVVEILYMDDGRQAKGTRIKHRLVWDALPEDVRGRLLAEKHDARFQLFPEEF